RFFMQSIAWNHPSRQAGWFRITMRLTVLPVNCTILGRFVLVPIRFGGCLNRALKKVVAVS
ncbi:MAG: hypothetical protein ACRDOE_05345, partial [Streptosporangiaceae bacterium]